MKEQTVLKIALICALAGVVILYFISDNVSIDEKAINKIDNGNIEESVKITGRVERISNLENVAFLEISQPSSITVIVFGNLNASAGDNVEVIGKIDEYNGKLEVIGQRIRVVR